MVKYYYRTRFRELVRQKETAENRTITKADIHRETGLDRPVIDRFWKGTMHRVEPKAVFVFTQWLNCTQDDLLEVVEEEEVEEEIAAPAA